MFLFRFGSRLEAAPTRDYWYVGAASSRDIKYKEMGEKIN